MKTKQIVQVAVSSAGGTCLLIASTIPVRVIVAGYGATLLQCQSAMALSLIGLIILVGGNLVASEMKD